MEAAQTVFMQIQEYAIVYCQNLKHRISKFSFGAYGFQKTT